MNPLRGWKSRLASVMVADGLPAEFRAGFLCSLFFGAGRPLDDPRDAEDFFEMTRWRWFHGPVSVHAWNVSADPVADLCRIPLPEELAKVVRDGANSETSLYHALVAFVGSPLSAKPHGSAFFELILFAAAWIHELTLGEMATRANGSWCDDEVRAVAEP